MIEFRPLEANDIEVRVAQVSEKGCSLLLYKDARCDMRILDETVGCENWMCEYSRVGDGLFCKVSVLCQTASGTFTWVDKEDVGTESNMEPTKGEASDAFKRACFKWGIGRELYTAPFIWVEKGLLERHRVNERSGKWTCYDRFRVNHIEVKDGRIADLEITNERGITVYQMGRKVSAAKKRDGNTAKPETAPQNAPQGRYDAIKALKAEAIGLGVSEQGIESWIAATFKGKDKRAFSDSDIRRTEEYLRGLIEDMRKLEAVSAEGMNPDA